MTWQGDEVRVSDTAQGQPSLRAEFQLSRHITSQLMPLQYAMSSSSMLCILLHQPPPPLQVFFYLFLFLFLSFLPLPITQFHFLIMEILKTSTIIYEKTSQKFPFTNLWKSDKQSLNNVPKINNQYICGYLINNKDQVMQYI